MDIKITVANQSQWNIVSPLAEMEITKKGRCMNPPLRFKVEGLETERKYIPSIEFERREMEHKFDKQDGTWKPWRVSAPLPEQKWTLEERTGEELMEEGLDFSTMLITSDKDSEAANRAVLQSLHVYSPLVVLTPVDNPEEVRRFKDGCLDFVVITKISQRLRKHRALLNAQSPPKESTKKKRAAEMMDSGAPEAKRARESAKASVPMMDQQRMDYQPVLQQHYRLNAVDHEFMSEFLQLDSFTQDNDENQPPAPHHY